MARIIGIDLGTTNTAVAVLDGGRPRVIEDDRGYKVLPSVVSAKGDGRFVVGQAAHNLILTRPERTVFGCKRLMGRRFDSPEVEAVRKRVQYQIREAPDGGVQVLVGEQWMTPQEVAAVVLQVARTIAERGLGEPVEEAVITVPAYFNHAQRKATLEAAQLAGLRCERLLNEPTAAALAYGHRKNVDRTVAVFDLGGGTFDISVLHLSNGVYEILATAGDTFLGGEDFDWRVAEWLADGFQARTRVDLREDRNAVQRLKDAAERAKCELSFTDRANIVVPHLTANESIDTVLTRSKLEELTLDLVERACTIARQAVAEAGLQMSDLDEVVLVGGQTRMPRVREMVSGVFGRDPSRTVHPEEAVAVGAAVHAANLGDTEAEKVVLLDVTPFEIGIDTTRGTFVPIIERNARIPVSAVRTFATVHDQQTAVRVTVRQGLSRVASENEFLGEFLFEGLTAAPRLQTKVDVGFRIDSNGMLHVSATEKGTGERRNITIRNYAEHAQAPALPDAEQARVDAEARARRAVEEAKGGAKGATAAGKSAPAPGAAAKKSFLDGLFGRKKKEAAAARPAAAVAAAAAATTATNGAAAAGLVNGAAAGAAGAGIAAGASLAAAALSRDAGATMVPDDGPPPGDPFHSEPPAQIDLTDMEPVDDGPSVNHAAPQLDPLDEEVLYEETGATASLGLAGHPAGAETLPMSMDELFGSGTESVGGDPFGADPFGSATTTSQSPFASGEPTTSTHMEDLFGGSGLSAADLFDAPADEDATVGVVEADLVDGDATVGLSAEDLGALGPADGTPMEEDIFATGDDGAGVGEVDVFGDGFAMVFDAPGDAEAPLPEGENPFGGDDHTEIDSEALAALHAAGAPNLAAAGEGDELPDVGVDPLDGGLGPDLGDLFGDEPATAEVARDALADALLDGPVGEVTHAGFDGEHAPEVTRADPSVEATAAEATPVFALDDHDGAGAPSLDVDGAGFVALDEAPSGDPPGAGSADPWAQPSADEAPAAESADPWARPAVAAADAVGADPWASSPPVEVAAVEEEPAAEEPVGFVELDLEAAVEEAVVESAAVEEAAVAEPAAEEPVGFVALDLEPAAEEAVGFVALDLEPAAAEEPAPIDPWATAPAADEPAPIDPWATAPAAEEPVPGSPDGASPSVPEPLEVDLGELDAELVAAAPADQVDDLFGADSDPFGARPLGASDTDAPFPRDAAAEAAAPEEPGAAAEGEDPGEPIAAAEPSGATGFALLEPIPAAPVAVPNEWATDSEITRLTRRPDSAPSAAAPVAEAPARRRKPARVKLQYRDFEVFVAEYRENLRRGGTFIRTEKPLPVGRECLFEIGAPGLDAPLVFPAVVTFVATAAPGQEAGMGVEYQLDDGGRRDIERVLNRR